MLTTGAKAGFFRQAAPVAISATGTLTIANLLVGLINTTGTAAISLTLPTGTLCDSGITAPALPIDAAFEWGIVNTGTVAAIITLVAGTGHTIVGAATTAIATSSHWRTRKTAANTFVTYRVG